MSLKIVYLGSGQFGIESLEALRNSRHDLRFIVTQPSQPAGRGRKCCPTAVSCWAENHIVPFIEAGNVNDDDIVKQIKDCEPDLIVVIAFGQKIGNELIEMPPKGTINVHASILPKYRGAAPINWAIVNGEMVTGNSIITVVDKIDAGDILGQSQIEIEPGDTAGSLHDKLAKDAAPLLLRVIEQIAGGTAVYTKQDSSKVTYAPKMDKTNGYLDFNEPAEIVSRKIRGFWPWPGAAADYLSRKTGKSVRVTIALAEPVEINEKSDLPPGTLDENLNIICGQGALKVLKIKPSGSALMDFKCFTNGRQTISGDVFEKIGN